MQKINICGIPHTIRYMDSNFEAGVVHYGEIDYQQAEIRINKNVHPEIQKETLCHEILHGILIHLGKEDEAMDEEYINLLSNAIYQSFEPKVYGK